MRLDQAPDNIALFRLSALGDATHTVPVYRALRDRWRDTLITWIIGKLEYRLVGALAEQDPRLEFIVYDKRGGLPAFRGLRGALGGRRFDLLLHMQVALRANLLSRLVDAPVRLGWNAERSRDRHQWFITDSVANVPFQHQVQAFLEFPRALGIEVREPTWDLPVGDEDRAWAEQELPGEEPTLVISPCSSHRLRNWAAERYAAVADHAAARGWRVALAGGPAAIDRETGDAIRTAMKSEPVDLIGRDTLTQSLAVLDRANALLTPDSGPAHMASALDTPVLGVYAATWARRSGPYRSLDLTVDRYRQAARQYRKKEPEELRWGHRIEEPGVMDLVEVDDVIEKFESLPDT